MPYTDITYTGESARAKAARAGFAEPDMTTKTEVAGIEKLELVCSSFNDAGSDWSEWRAYDQEGELLATRRMGGY